MGTLLVPPPLSLPRSLPMHMPLPLPLSLSLQAPLRVGAELVRALAPRIRCCVGSEHTVLVCVTARVGVEP